MSIIQTKHRWKAQAAFLILESTHQKTAVECDITHSIKRFWDLRICATSCFKGAWRM